MEYTQNNIPSSNNDKQIFSVTESGTYKKLLRLIVEDAMSSLPTDCYEVFKGNYQIFVHLKDKLIEMRQKGVAFLAYDKNTKKFYRNVTLQRLGEDNYRFLVGNKEIDRESVLIIGDLEEPENAKLNLSHAELMDICRYENMHEQLDDDYKNSFKDLYKVKDFEDINTDPAKKKRFDLTMFNLLKRKKNHLIAMDKEDEITSVSRGIQDVKWLLEKKESKVCFNASTPYSRLFGESASGYNATGEGDRRNWNMDVRFFQLHRIFPVLGDFAEMLNVEEAFRQVEVELIEATDKLHEMQVRETEQRIAENAYMIGTISKEELRTITARNLSLKEKETSNISFLNNNTNNYQQLTN